jgi:hypothetical protein
MAELTEAYKVLLNCCNTRFVNGSTGDDVTDEAMAKERAKQREKTLEKTWLPWQKNPGRIGFAASLANPFRGKGKDGRGGSGGWTERSKDEIEVTMEMARWRREVPTLHLIPIPMLYFIVWLTQQCRRPKLWERGARSIRSIQYILTGR